MPKFIKVTLIPDSHTDEFIWINIDNISHMLEDEWGTEINIGGDVVVVKEDVETILIKIEAKM